MTAKIPEVRYQMPRDILHLTEHESAAITALALDLLGRHEHHELHDDALLYDVESSAGRLPTRLQTALRRFRDLGNTDGTLIIDGLPVESEAPTPCRARAEPHWSQVPVATFTQLMAMTLLGPVVSYHDEKEGRLVQDVFPKPGQEDRQENSGSVLLELHTEDGFLEHPPHYLSLLCMRSDHDSVAATLACGIRRVLPALNQPALRILRQERFQVAFSSSFTGGEDGWWSRPLAVIAGPDEDPHLTVDFHAMVGLDDQAQAALDTLQSLILGNLVGAVLQPRQLMIVDNRMSVHGRTSFAPRYDETDRWLRRCFSVSDLRAVRGQVEHGRALRSVGHRYERTPTPAPAMA